VIPISQDEIHHFSDGTNLVQSSVDIVNWNGFGELPSMELVALGVVAVNELSGGSTVHEGVDGLHLPLLMAPGVSHRVPQGDPLSRSGDIYTQFSDVKSGRLASMSTGTGFLGVGVC